MALPQAVRDFIRRLERDIAHLHLQNHSMDRRAKNLEAMIQELRDANFQQAQTINKLECSHEPLFTCFPRLPPELRMKIWSSTIEPRVIGLEPEIPLSDRKTHPVWWFGDVASAAASPVISQVCHESRMVFLREYRRLPGEIIWGADKNGVPVDVTRFIHLQLDTLYLSVSDKNFSSSISILYLIHLLRKTRYHRNELYTIRNIALPCMLLRELKAEPLLLLKQLDRLPSLEEVTFVCNCTWHYKEIGGCIQNPATKDELHRWEKETARISWLKDTFADRYKKWNNVKVSVAMYRSMNEKGWVDKRRGLPMIGPSNECVEWKENAEA